MQTLQIDSLIADIKNREQKIEQTKLEIITFWFMQGKDLIRLSEELDSSYDGLVPLVNISKSSIYNYTAIAKDTRIEKLLSFSTSKTETVESKHIEQFNQKNIVKLTHLNDIEFTTALIEGKLPTAKIEPPLTVSLTLDEEIEFKEKQIETLNNDLDNLKRKKIATASTAEVIDVLMVESNPIKKVQRKVQRVEQIDKNTNNTIKIYKSLSDASKTTGFSSSSISKCATGKQKEAHGFRWRYLES